MRNTWKIAGLGIGLLGSVAALAAEADKQITLPAPKVGLMYRYEMAYDDDGLNKDAKADVPYLTQGLRTFRLVAEGKVNDQLTYGLRAGMEGKAMVLDYGFVRWALGEKHAILLGKMKSRVYGWEYRTSNPLTIFKSKGMVAAPFSFDEMIAFENKYSWGMITIQLTEDRWPTYPTQVSGNTGSSNGWTYNAGGTIHGKQPALLLEYIGEFGPIKPIVQVGSYDNGHSSLYNVGLRFEATDILADLDYTVHNMGTKGVKAGDTKDTNLVSTSSNIALNVSYQVSNWKPFLHWSSYDMDEYTNPNQAKSSVNSVVGKFDDNGTVTGLGVECTEHGDAFRPYLALMNEAGKFPAVAGGDKTMSRNQLIVGVKGQF